MAGCGNACQRRVPVALSRRSGYARCRSVEHQRVARFGNLLQRHTAGRFEQHVELPIAVQKRVELAWPIANRLCRSGRRRSNRCAIERSATGERNSCPASLGTSILTCFFALEQKCLGIVKRDRAAESFAEEAGRVVDPGARRHVGLLAFEHGRRHRPTACRASIASRSADSRCR